MMMEFQLPRIPTEKKWYVCPHCGKNLLIYNNTAKCQGIYVWCRQCKKTIEVKI